MKFWLWRTGEKSLRVKEKFIRKLYMSNLISPVLGQFAFSPFRPFRGQLIQSVKAMPMGANLEVFIHCMHA